jgi:regulator of sigma D
MTTQLDSQQHSKPSTQATRSRWLKIDAIIHTWLKERQELLVLYTRACENSTLLQRFCQILVDYISAGHFAIFEKLAQAKEICTPEQPALDKILLEKISKTTLTALDFNDNYADNPSLYGLSSALSVLGEQLAHRMEWEDQLLQTYFKLTQTVK